MNTLSRTITGIAFIVIGIGLIVASSWAHYITLIYGIPLLLVGIFILFNKNEDRIEQRKDLNKKKANK